MSNKGSESYKYLIIKNKKTSEILFTGYIAHKGDFEFIPVSSEDIDYQCEKLGSSEGLKLFTAERERIKFREERDGILEEIASKIK